MKFNKIRYNIKRLKPRVEDIELNKCTHKMYCKEDGLCGYCGTQVSPDNIFDENGLELAAAADTIIDYLECMKMIVNNCMSNKEIRATKKYFNMIPLLNNIDTLYDMCIDALNRTELEIVDLYESIEYEKDLDKEEGENNE